MKSMLCLTMLLTVSPAVTAEQSFTSSVHRTDLIELYTSEGCSSCPPAERKMNAYADHDDLWKTFVPVAFHVDYWNYIGWKDPYSSPVFTTRQRTYSAQWESRSIYTPCFVLNGAPTRAIKQPGQSGKSPGVLAATVNGGRVEVSFMPTDPEQGIYRAWVAPLSGPESSQVTAGENRGRKLEHCFVALGLVGQQMHFNGKAHAATLSMPDHSRTRGIAVWVSGVESLEPLQAAGGWLKGR